MPSIVSTRRLSGDPYQPIAAMVGAQREQTRPVHPSVTSRTTGSACEAQISVDRTRCGDAHFLRRDTGTPL